jgi:hypothetical protein
MKKQDICSPHANLHADKYTCFTSENLHILKDHWNARHPNNMIKSKDDRQIWEELNIYMKENLCENEKCWLRKIVHDMNAHANIFDESFVPSMPLHWGKKPRAWLSDLDISRAMKQYEEAYPNFIFIGPTPIDYDACNKLENDWVWPELKFFDLKKYIYHEPNAHMKIGMVFNLDNHTEGGSHWVALFVDILNAKIYYFDSNGDIIPKKIRALADVIKSQGKDHDMKFTLSANYPTEHQQENTECGIYVIFFLTNMLMKNNWELFKKGSISDDEIFKCREKYFSKD